MRSASFFDLLPMYPPMISQIWSACLYVIIIGIIYAIYKRIKSMNNRRALIFWKDGTQSIKSYPIEDGKLSIRKSGIVGDKKKDWTPTVKSENVIPARRSFKTTYNPFGFKQRDLFIAVEDSPELITMKGAIDFEAKSDLIPSLLLKTWTKKEIAQFIKKALAQGIVQRKVFSDSQFYMFLMVMIFNSLLLVMIVRGMGII